ncbi:thioredoxin family protein [Pontibacter vulgaris]|uniref:thioredoxin family protein n=1 Tax=Pontibacter vulgaris TaxID=2905679 RepID=UPI001FA79A79|nr:thioredoxin family protein [Pontibacter vulgaris]
METASIVFSELVNPLSYTDYKLLVDDLVATQKTTGPEQTEEKIGFTKLNQQRMKRVEKQFTLLPELSEILQTQQTAWKWLVLSEAWCGDGAQLIPAISAIADAAPFIELQIVLRDENPELMDTCLTNGSRSIPKLLCVDAVTGERIFTWGPRPASIQQQVIMFKAANPHAGHDELSAQLHMWYAKDRSQSLQQDLVMVFKKEIMERRIEASV